MALVVFLKGINVGGHRRFRPAALVSQLQHLGVVNIGAAGTFVVRRRVTKTAVRAELTRRLPFQTDVAICEGREVVRLVAEHRFAGRTGGPELVRFVSILSRRPRVTPRTPIAMPSAGKWLLKVLAIENRFVFGVYRRHLKTIGYLRALERVFGVPVTTRNVTTMARIARLLTATPRRPPTRRQASARGVTTFTPGGAGST